MGILISCSLQGKRKKKVSESGGWCQGLTSAKKRRPFTDYDLASALADALGAGSYVASFGDSVGLYKSYFDDRKAFATYDAYDGAPDVEEASHGSVHHLDLSVPQFGLPVYDWVVSVEVAEHIPRQFEPAFADNLARHARSGIVLSWATPGQPGTGHTNPRPFSHVKKLMGRKGFHVDPEMSR